MASMARDEILSNCEPEPRSIRPARDKWVEDAGMQLRRHTRPIVFNLHTRDEPVPAISNVHVRQRTCTQRDMTPLADSLHSVARYIEQRLDELVPVKHGVGQTRVVIPVDE